MIGVALISTALVPNQKIIYQNKHRNKNSGSIRNEALSVISELSKIITGIHRTSGFKKQVNNVE